MNILITGAFGFVGSNLSKFLHTTGKNQLTALDINEITGHSYSSFFTWDQLEDISWDTIDTIIHLAGKAHDTKNTSEEQVYFDINLGLTQKIFEYFLSSNATKFIYFSSVKAVADSVKGDKLTEDIEPSPGTPYGRSKLEAEKYLTTRLRDYTTTRRHDDKAIRECEGEIERRGDRDKKLYILRPAMIHGPGNKGNLNLLYKLVSKGIPWPLGAYENKRSFTSIDNLAYVVQQLIEKDIEPGIYNMADDNPIATNRLIELIASSKKKSARMWKISKNLIHVGAKVGGKLHLPLNPERLKKLTESYVASNNKLKKALGIEKMPVSAEEGMKRTLESFQ
ncbi:MAG TPA: NAD-dependent epimerase/dehydratase family protein [Prolixibacteraceae bacterium]|nr:NAD-dependent epimerase/dehydratase family protein [Prolixibacteraceae bacterium]